MSNINLWDKFERDVLISSIKKQLENDDLDQNDFCLLSLYTKKLMLEENITDKDIKWLQLLSQSLVFNIRPLVLGLNNHVNRNNADKILIEMIKLISGINEINQTLLEKVSTALSDQVLKIKSISDKFVEETLILEIKETLNLLQILIDCVKSQQKPYLDFLTCDIVDVFINMLIMEWVSEKDFVVINNLMSFFLDLNNMKHKEVYRKTQFHENLFSTR